MTATLAVAHYPEGAGHATRMLALADALSAAGAEVRLAGGGAGSRFVELNGYEAFEPTTVDYVDTYQGGSLWQVLAESVPATAGRVTDYIDWLRAHDPDALVTDDMFAAMAAVRTGVPLYVLKHDVPSLYRDRVERVGAAFHTGFQLTAAREFFYPAVWPASAADPDGATRVPPVALEGDARERGDAEVVVVPSHYSDLGRVADNLARQGYDVLDVGRDDWGPVPSLLPYIRAADVVVCSGYSTVMDAAVAGTPSVVHPSTDEQEAVARWLDRFDVTGFAVAERPLDVLDAVASPPAPPAHENGADVVADAVLDDLRDGPTATRRTSVAGDSDHPASTVRVARRRAHDRTVAALAAVGLALRAVALRARMGLRNVARRAAGAARRAVARGARATAATAERSRRYALATVVLVFVALVFVRGRLRRSGGRGSTALRACAMTLGRRLANAQRRVAGVVPRHAWRGR